MGILKLAKSSVIDPLLKSLYPAGLGVGTRGGRPDFTPMAQPRYTGLKTKQTPTSRQFAWQHAMSSALPKADVAHHEHVAALATHIFEHAKTTPHDFLRGFHVKHGNYHSMVDHVVEPATKKGGRLLVEGSVHYGSGGDHTKCQKVGEFQREYRRPAGAEMPEAHHHWFEMYSGQHRQSGFGTHFTHELERHYKRAGISKVHLHAGGVRGMHIGPYVWAMHGYDFEKPAHRQRVVDNFNKYLHAQDLPSFKRRGAHRGHPIHTWDIASHEVRGRKVGKEFLTREHDEPWKKHYHGVKNLDSADEGYQVGLAYQRSHMARGAGAKRAFSKSYDEKEGFVNPECEVPHCHVEGAERHMEPWHEDVQGEVLAHEAVKKVVDEHHPVETTTTLKVDEIAHPDLQKARMWQADGQWFVNEDWLVKNAEPWSLMLQKAIPKVRPVSSPSQMAGKLKNPMPHLSSAASAPKLKRPSIPKGVGVTLPSNHVPRTPDGRINYGAVPAGSAFWVTIKSPDSPLEGRAIRIVKRGDQMFAAAGGSQTHGKIRSTSSPAVRADINREGKILGEGLPEKKISREHLTHGTPEVADISKMSNKDIRSAAGTHAEVRSGGPSPEQQQARAKAKATSDAPLARAERSKYGRAKRRSQKTIRGLQKQMLTVLGIEHDEKGNPSHLTREELELRRKQVDKYLKKNRRYKKLNPDTQMLVANTLNNEMTRLDNWLREQEKMAVEAEVRKHNNLRTDEGPALPVDIGLAGVDSTGEAAGHREGMKGGRSVVIKPSTVDTILNSAEGVDKGLLDPDLAADQIKGAIQEDVDKNVQAGKAAEGIGDADAEAAKKELEAAAKDPGALVLKHGRERQSVKKQLDSIGKLARERRLTSPSLLQRMDQVDYLRRQMAQGGRDQHIADAFQASIESGDVGPYAGAIQGAANDLLNALDLVTSTKKGILDPEAKKQIGDALRSQKMDPQTYKTLFGRLGSDYNHRTMSSALGVEAQAFKYGNLSDYGIPNEGTDKRQKDIFALAATPEGREKLYAMGDAALHLGPYYQSEALKTFDSIHHNYFPGAKRLNMQGYVRLYGMQVASHIYAYHLWKSQVLNISDEDAMASLSPAQQAQVKSGELDLDKVKESEAFTRATRFKRFAQAIARDNARTFPVVERDTLKREADLESQWDALQQQHDAAVKRNDEYGILMASQMAHELTAKGAQNIGNSLGSMQASAEFLNALENVGDERRMARIPLSTRYGSNKEMAQWAAKRLFKGVDWEKHLVDEGTPEVPMWTVQGTVADWGKNALPSLMNERAEEDDRKQLRVGNDENAERDDNGNVWAKNDSLPEWLRPGGEFIKDGVRIKHDQHNAVNVLDQYPTGVLDHTTGFGKTFIAKLHGLNQIGKARKAGKKHRMLIIHSNSAVWSKGEGSSWHGKIADDAPIYTTSRGETTKAATMLKELTTKGEGIYSIHHADLRNPELRKALLNAKFHSVLVDEPQTPNMMLTKKGGYTGVAKMLYKGEGGLPAMVRGEGQNDHTGAHVVLSSATVANADSPKHIYNQLEPVLKRAGRTMGARKYWMDMTEGLGSTASTANAGVNSYVRHSLGPVQVSDPNFKYNFPMTRFEHRAKLTPMQVDEVSHLERPEALNEIRDNDLLKPPPGYRLKAGEKPGGAIERDASVESADINKAKSDYRYIGNTIKSQYDSIAKLYNDAHHRLTPEEHANPRTEAKYEQRKREWQSLLKERQRDRINEVLYGMPRRADQEWAEKVSTLKQVAPLLHSMTQRIKAGEKSVVFSFGSRYQAEVMARALRAHLHTEYRGKGDAMPRVIVSAHYKFDGHDSCQTDGGVDGRLDGDIATFQKDGSPAEVILFVRPLSGKNIGKAGRVVLGGNPRDENGLTNAMAIQQSLGRATRDRDQRVLEVETMNPEYNPEMRAHDDIQRQINSAFAINPAIHSAMGPVFKSQTWLKVDVLRKARVDGLSARSVSLTTVRVENA